MYRWLQQNTVYYLQQIYVASYDEILLWMYEITVNVYANSPRIQHRFIYTIFISCNVNENKLTNVNEYVMWSEKRNNNVNANIILR